MTYKDINTSTIWGWVDDMAMRIEIGQEENHADKALIPSAYFLGQRELLNKLVIFLKEIEHEED